jgi:hypothetical protein
MCPHAFHRIRFCGQNGLGCLQHTVAFEFLPTFAADPAYFPCYPLVPSPLYLVPSPLHLVPSPLYLDQWVSRPMMVYCRESTCTVELYGKARCAQA